MTSRASGVTLDRFCGSGITAVNLAAATIMAGHGRPGGRRRQRDDVHAQPPRPRRRSAGDGHRQPAPARPAPADQPGRLRRRHRHHGRHHPRGRSTTWPWPASSAPPHAIADGHFNKSLVTVYREDGSVALDHEEFPRPQTTLEGLAALKPSFEAMADIAIDDERRDLPQPDPAEVPRPRHQVHPPRRQLLGRGGRRRRDAAGLAGLRQGQRPEAPRPRRGDRQHGR